MTSPFMTDFIMADSHSMVPPSRWEEVVDEEENEVIVTDEMAYFSLQVLADELSGMRPTVRFNIPSTPYGVHISWRKRGLSASLRGSAGTFDPIPLPLGLREMTIASALHEQRFTPPLTLDEIAQVQITVSIIYKKEQCLHFLDWVIGVHGLEVKIPGRTLDGKLKITHMLPEYPLSRDWTRTETINHLIRQAGFSGTVTGEERQKAVIFRFRIQQVTKGMDDFRRYVAKKKEEEEAAAAAAAEILRKEKRQAALARILGSIPVRRPPPKPEPPTTTYIMRSNNLSLKAGSSNPTNNDQAGPSNATRVSRGMTVTSHVTKPTNRPASIPVRTLSPKLKATTVVGRAIKPINLEFNPNDMPLSYPLTLTPIEIIRHPIPIAQASVPAGRSPIPTVQPTNPSARKNISNIRVPIPSERTNVTTRRRSNQTRRTRSPPAFMPPGLTPTPIRLAPIPILPTHVDPTPTTTNRPSIPLIRNPKPVSGSSARIGRRPAPLTRTVNPVGQTSTAAGGTHNATIRTVNPVGQTSASPGETRNIIVRSPQGTPMLMVQRIASIGHAVRPLTYPPGFSRLFRIRGARRSNSVHRG